MSIYTVTFTVVLESYQLDYDTREDAVEAAKVCIASPIWEATSVMVEEIVGPYSNRSADSDEANP